MSFLTCYSFFSEASLMDSFFFAAVTLMAISFASFEVNWMDFCVSGEEILSDFSCVSVEVNLTDFSFVAEVS